MKKVLFAVSLVVNIALAGGLFYTITEMNKLDKHATSANPTGHSSGFCAATHRLLFL